MQDPYKTLGVAKDAKDSEIKQAFRKLAKEYHPDKGGDQKRFKEINEAYDILKDPQKRQQYDFGGFNNQQGFNGFTTGGDFDDILREFFHSGPMRSGFSAMHRQTMRNKDVKINLICTLEDIYFQTQKDLSVKIPSGETKNIKLTIPVDAEDGTTIRFRGLGDNSHKELPPGNLLVQVQIKPHDTYARKTYDLHMEHKINILDVLAGITLHFDHISKSKITSTLPELSQPNQTLRFKGKGMPKPNGTHGDLYVQLKPYTPTQVNKKVMKSIKDYRDE